VDYTSAFEISAAGMNLERARVDATALNLANMHSTRGADGTLFQPVRVVAGSIPVPAFAASYETLRGDITMPANVRMEPTLAPPRLVHEPGHPQADEKGFVAYPGINHLGEMVNLVSALRAYESNVIAMNAAKTMALKALEIGGTA
jgi:flagellar basal-body rod protein FlgC